MKLKDVKPGDILVGEPGYCCFEEGKTYEVFADEDNELYVNCRVDRHYLIVDGGADDDGNIIGLREQFEYTNKIKCPICFGLGGYGLSNDGGLAERCDTCEGFGTISAPPSPSPDKRD